MVRGVDDPMNIPLVAFAFSDAARNATVRFRGRIESTGQQWSAFGAGFSFGGIGRMKFKHSESSWNRF